MVTLPPTAACVQASLGTIAFWLTFASSNRQLRDTRECKLHSQVVRGLLLRTQQSQALQTNCVVCLRGLFVLGRIHSFPFLPLAVCMLGATPEIRPLVFRHCLPPQNAVKKNDRNETRFRAQSPKRKRHKPYVAPNVPLPRIRAAIQARIPASESGPFRIDTCNRGQPHGVQGCQPITQDGYLVEPKHNIRQQ